MGVAWLAAWGGATAAYAESRIKPDDLLYLGAFRLPEKHGQDYVTWEYSNGALAYYPDGDPGGRPEGHPGLLFIAGHVYKSCVAEVSIPAPIRSRAVASLNTAQFLQPMTDVLSSPCGWRAS